MKKLTNGAKSRPLPFLVSAILKKIWGICIPFLLFTLHPLGPGGIIYFLSFSNSEKCFSRRLLFRGTHPFRPALPPDRGVVYLGTVLLADRSWVMNFIFRPPDFPKCSVCTTLGFPGRRRQAAPEHPICPYPQWDRITPPLCCSKLRFRPSKVFFVPSSSFCSLHNPFIKDFCLYEQINGHTICIFIF